MNRDCGAWLLPGLDLHEGLFNLNGTGRKFACCDPYLVPEIEVTVFQGLHRNNTREERKWDKRPRRGVEALPLLMHSPIPAKLCVIQVKHCTKLNRILQCKWLLVYGVNKF